MARFQLVVGKVEFVADNVKFVNRILEKSFVFSKKKFRFVGGRKKK